MVYSSASGISHGLKMPRGITKVLARTSHRLWFALAAVSFGSFLTTTRYAFEEEINFASSPRRKEQEGAFFDPPPPPATFSVLRKLQAKRAENAIVRPFPPHDAESLLSSFQAWDEFFPCDMATISDTPKTDLVLSFSQMLHDHPKAELLVHKFRTEFGAKQGWSRCFDKLVIYEAQIDPSQDIYQKGETRSEAWVIGPNVQFQRTFHAMVTAQYKIMILVEEDTTPRVENWLNRLLQDSEAHKPFAVLGRYEQRKHCETIHPLAS